MEKVARLLGTLLVLSLVLIACKKEDLSNGRSGGNDLSFNEGFSNKGKSPIHYNCTASDHDDYSNLKHGKKITICHNGNLITISMHAVLQHFTLHSTDLLFSCDPAKGISYDDIASTLTQIIQSRKLHGSSDQVAQHAFNIWYHDYYLAGKWTTPSGGGGTVVTPPDPGPTMSICHSGQLVNVTYPIAFADFQNGDVLFSCDATAGVLYSDVEGPLLDIIYDYTLDPNASDVMYQAFLIWYTDYYLAGNWPPDAGGAGGGGSGGGSDGGSGTGTDSTVVISN